MNLEQDRWVEVLKKKRRIRDVFDDQPKFLLVQKEKIKVNSKNKIIYYIGKQNNKNSDKDKEKKSRVIAL